MKILDFSKNKLDLLNSEIQWQKSILDFLDEWNSKNDFVIAHTSGSTGKPKEIRLPKSAMRLSAQLTGEFFDLKTGNTALLCMPVNFIAGKMMIVRSIELGLKLYCTEAKGSIDLTEYPQLDFVPMTPMQVEKSFDSIHKIKTLLIGGAPLSDELRNQLLQTKTEAYESYGMTETITHIGLKKISEKSFQCLNRVEIRKDERNCLVIKTPYFDDEIVTNDLVEIIDRKHFKWLGRFDHVINSGGIKLIPEQIEEKLKPYVQQEFIISSLPDKTLGEKLILIIEGEKFDFSIPEGILNKFENPKGIYFIKEFPRTESGKVKRQILKGICQKQI
ncbi:MAG: AMP-binding protein [Weeksellaceae bacterium]